MPIAAAASNTRTGLFSVLRSSTHPAFKSQVPLRPLRCRPLHPPQLLQAPMISMTQVIKFVKQNCRSHSHCSRDRDCTSRGKCSFLTLPHAMRATKLAGTLTLLSCANSKPKPTVNSQGSKILLRDLPTTKWPTCRLQQISARMRSPLQQGFG
jgi:hypothetical protein